MITDGIRANGLHSFHDFDLYFNRREVKLPKKKSIRETVPFMNGYYDFSALNGSPTWESRTVTYVFDIVGDTPEETEEYADRVLDWLCNLHDVDIFDDTMPDYHWHGSYDDATPSLDESETKMELSVDFICYPFKIANTPIVHNFKAGTHTVVNNGQAVAPIVKSDMAAAIQIGNYVQGIPANSEIKLSIDLARGTNQVIVTGDGTVTFKYYREVM